MGSCDTSWLKVELQSYDIIFQYQHILRYFILLSPKPFASYFTATIIIINEQNLLDLYYFTATINAGAINANVNKYHLLPFIT